MPDAIRRFNVIQGGRGAKPAPKITPYLVCNGCLSIRPETEPFQPCRLCDPPRYGVIRFKSYADAERWSEQRRKYREEARQRRAR